MDERTEALAAERRREVRRAVGRQSRLVLGYAVLLTTAGYALLLAVNPEAARDASGALFNRYAGELSLAGTVAGMLFIALALRRRFLSALRPIEATPRRMSARALGGVVVLLVGAQVAFAMVTAVLDALAGTVDYSVTGSNETLQMAGGTVAMFLYANVVGPVAEEIVFRGVVMGALARFGKAFAIVFSALLFGLFHADIAQGGFAFCVGLVLGFVAMRYSLAWSMALHVFNNFVLADLLTGLFEALPPLGQDAFDAAFLVVGIVGSLWVLWSNREAVRAWLAEHRAEPGTARAALTSPWFIAFALLQLGLSLLAFAPL